MSALRWIVLAAAVALIPGEVVASEKGRVEELNLGTYWYGPKVTKDDLVGKVVLVELWGS